MVVFYFTQYKKKEQQKKHFACFCIFSQLLFLDSNSNLLNRTTVEGLHLREWAIFTVRMRKKRGKKKMQTNTETDVSLVLLPPQARHLTVPLEGVTSPQTKGVIWKIAQYVFHTARLGSLEREVRRLLGPYGTTLSIFSELNPDRRVFSSPNCSLGNIIYISHIFY